MSAYRRERQDEHCTYRQRENAHRAFHLHRITSKFTTTISAEGVRRLARLLAADENAEAED